MLSVAEPLIPLLFPQTTAFTDSYVQTPVKAVVRTIVTSIAFPMTNLKDYFKILKRF